MANINSVITYNANLSPAQAQIKALTGQIAGLTAAFNTLDKSALSAQRNLAGAFARDVGNIGGFTTQMVQAHNAVENFGKQIAANKLTMRESFREAIAGYTKQNSLMKRLAEQQVKYQQSVAVPVGGGQAMMMTPAALSATGTSAAMAAQKFSIFNQLIDNGATSMLNWGKNTQWAGRQLMVGFTLPLAMLAAVTSKQFRDLDKELTRFQKVYGSDLGGAISESTSRMREQVKQLAFDISRTYGIAAQETAALAADIAATGAEGEQLMESVQQTTRLAVLGEVDRQEAMKATLALQSAFKLNTNELAESINFLNAVENQTSATLEDLATAIPKVGPVVRSLGGDVEDLAALLVAMREGGIPAAEAANALKSGLASLINPTKQASEVAKKFGIDLVSIVEANKGQLMPTIFAMQNALSGLDDFGRARVIEQIFGKYQFARISALFDNIGKTGSQTQAVLELAAKSSTELAAVANQEIKTLTESTAVRFQRAIEDLKNAVMPLGEVLTETLIPIFQKIGEGVRIFADFFQALPEPVKNFTKYVVALTALAGPIIMLVGLFGNLIANGLKIGMVIMRLGARMAGLRVDKFELLNAEVMAAKLGVDNLTLSFTSQEAAMRKLVAIMSQYQTSLRQLATTNPALFIPGAIPGRGGSVPIKRQSGSSRPEFVPGSGRGDKIPAMLEPGEFIVNRAATEKYAPVLMQMNRGTLQGFQQGTQLSHLYSAKDQNVGSLLQLPFLDQGARAMLMLIQSIHGADFQVKTYSNAVVGLSTTLNQSMERGEASIEMFRREISDTGMAFDPLREQLRVMISETGEFNGDLNLAEQAVGSFAQQMRAQAAGFKGSTFNAAQLESMSMAALAGVSDPRQRAALMRLFETPTAFSAGRGLTASNMYMFGQASGVPMYSGGEGKSKRIYAQLGPEEYLGVRPRSERIPLGNMPTYQGAQISPLSFALPVGARPLSQPYSTPTMYTPEGQRITKSMASSMGGTQRELFMKQIETNAATFIDDLAKAFVSTVARTLEAASPSKRADREMAIQGKNFGDGASQGFIKGYKSSAAGKPIISGPVGGTGIESISNAQKIAQADQSILKMKTLQQKFTADRVRTEIELGVLDDRLLQIRNSETMTAQEKLRATLALNQERIALEKTHQTALQNETRIQNIINGHKQRIADADQAQARSEQEEAKNAARRATASMVSPGGLYGPGGYAAFGTVGRMPKPEDVQSGPGDSLIDAMGELDLEKDDQDTRKKGRMGSLSSGGTNALLGLSMLTSTMTMFSGASGDAANKLMMFSTALMTATMAAQMFGGMGIGGAMVGGVKKIGGGLTSLGGKLAPAGRHAAPGLLSRGLMGAGGALAGGGAAAAGTVAAVAIPLVITAAGLYMYKKSLDEAKEKANAAFAEPTKTAEFFGKTIDGLGNALENIQAAGVSKELSSINSELRMAVSEDYAGLIEKLKTSVTTVGAADLGAAYTKMIISGMSAEEAQDSIKAIAAEAGYKGGIAFASAFSNGLLEAKTIEEAYQQTIDNISPESVAGQQTAASEAMKQQAIANPGLYGRSTPQVASRNFKNVLAGGPEFVQALKSSIEISQTAPELVAQNLDKIRESYLALNEDAGDILGLGTSAREMAFDEFKNMMGELDDPVINQLLDQLQNSTAETQALAIQMTALGVPLAEAKNRAGQFDDALARAAIDNASRLAQLEVAVDDAKQALLDFADSGPITAALDKIGNSVEVMQEKIKDYAKSREDEREAVEESFEAEQKSREDSIEAIQDEMETKRESFDEEMDQLDEKSDKIKKSSDAYIKSLQKNQKADSFYAQQRKTAFGALQKLASGDVFGFLQEREAMSEDARQFSYDQTIEGIEEKTDLELEAIDKVRERRQQEQDEYEKMMEDKIDGVQKLMDKESEMHENNMKAFDDETEEHSTQLERRLANRTSNNTRAKNLIDDIKEGETKSYREVTRVFGEETGKRYEELVKAEMAALQLKLQAQVSAKDIELKAAEQQLIDIYNSLIGFGNIPSNYQSATTYQTVSQTVGIPGFVSPPPIPRRASGGSIKGPGGPKSDVIPALLSNGEYVIQASSVSKYGKGMMDTINAGKFAEGGIVKLDKDLLESEGVSVKTARNTVKSIVDGGWPDDRVRLAYAIAMRESNGNPNAFSRYSPTNSDTGLFQINEKAYGGQRWFDLNKLKDPVYNSSMAYKYVSRKGEFFLPWALTPQFNGKTGWDWSYYANSSYFAPGSEARNETIRRTELFWNSFKGLNNKGNTGNNPGAGNKPGAGIGPLSSTIQGPGGGEGSRSSSRVQFGKASPQFVTGRMLPIPSRPGKPGKPGKPEKPGNGGGSRGNTDGALAVAFAKQQLGEPYVSNSDGPDSWDCSGLTAAAYNQGVPGGSTKYALASYSTSQADRLRIVARRTSGNPGDGGMPEIPNKFSVGDLLYFTNTPYPESYKHISMYAGNGQVIEAGNPVKMSPLNNDFNKKYFTFGGPPKARLAAGGMVLGLGGPRSDSIPAMLSNGEYVVKASSVAKYGKSFLDQVNAGSFSLNQDTSSMAQPAFNLPSMSTNSSNVNNYGGNSSNNVRIIINGAGGKSAAAIANKVASMINSSGNRRNHSRSI